MILPGQSIKCSQYTDEKHLRRAAGTMNVLLARLDLWEEPRPPPEQLELVCESYADYMRWQDDVRK